MSKTCAFTPLSGCAASLPRSGSLSGIHLWVITRMFLLTFIAGFAYDVEKDFAEA